MVRKDFGAFLCILVVVTKVASETLPHDLCAEPRIVENTANRSWGYITTPSYPGSGISYPGEMMQCTFKLLPKPDEQIQLTFSYFNLRQSDKVPASQSCDLSDSVKIFVNNSSQSPTDHGTMFGEYCGTKAPDTVMAVARPMTIQFTVRAKEDPRTSAVYMFRAKYWFLKDYGMKTIAQQNHTAGCHFTFNSDRMPASGTFESPNFGGVYPFSIGCLYTFRSFNNQTLALRFDHFDVEGQPGCRRPNDDMVQILEGEYVWNDFTAPAEEDPAKQRWNTTRTVVPKNQRSLVLRITL